MFLTTGTFVVMKPFLRACPPYRYFLGGTFGGNSTGLVRNCTEFCEWLLLNFINWLTISFGQLKNFLCCSRNRFAEVIIRLGEQPLTNFSTLFNESDIVELHRTRWNAYLNTKGVRLTKNVEIITHKTVQRPS